MMLGAIQPWSKRHDGRTVICAALEHRGAAGMMHEVHRAPTITRR
jgi:hypothetical protein